MSRVHQISGCRNPNRKADVVFVHGLGGDPYKTWRFGKGEDTSWPHWLGQEFPDVGVWSLEYAANPTKWARFLRWLPGQRNAGYAMSLTDRAVEVLNQLVANGLGQRPLMFICHSLGGLVIKQVLRAAFDSANQSEKQAVFNNTRAVVFLATPHQGATLATFLQHIPVTFPTVALKDLSADNPYLRDLHNWYRNHAEQAGIQTRSFFEMRRMGGVLIVEERSAHPGVGPDPVPLDEDHISISKPRERDALVCITVNDLIRKYLLTPTHSTVTGRTARATDAPSAEAVEYPTRNAVRQRILPLLRQNKFIFDTYGPHNDYRYNPESETAIIWRKKVLEQILPNNRKILAILDANKHLLTAGEIIILEKFRQHVDDLERRHLRGDSSGGGITFPQEMETILEEIDHGEAG